MNRAFVALEIKALDDDARTIEGWATTPEVDRMGATPHPFQDARPRLSTGPIA